MEVNRHNRVVRVTLGWLLFGALCVLAMGWLGGVIALRTWPAPAPLPDAAPDRLVTTVQEVTISPNTSHVERLNNVQRSVVLMARNQAGRVVAAATGVVVTNDGLVATVTEAAGEWLAIDYHGRELPLRLVGRDALFGVTFFRLSDSVLAPIDLRTEAVPVAYQLLGVSRSESTWLPRSFTFPVGEVSLPPELSPTGVQRVWRGLGTSDEALAGSPLLDDEGKLAGLLLNPGAGLALPHDHLAASIERVSTGQREADPLAELGLRVRYAFTPPTAPDGEQRFAAAITAVAPGSPAAAGGAAAGDLIVSIDERELRWEEIFLKQLAAAQPVQLGVRRGGADVTLTLAP